MRSVLENKVSLFFKYEFIEFVCGLVYFVVVLLILEDLFLQMMSLHHYCHVIGGWGVGQLIRDCTGSCTFLALFLTFLLFTKLQTTKLLILLRFYFHDVRELRFRDGLVRMVFKFLSRSVDCAHNCGCKILAPRF